MATYDSTFFFYDSFQKAVGDGVINLGSDVFRVALFTSAFVQDVTNTDFASLANELPTANGYTAGGAVVPGITWTQTGGESKWSGGSVVWAASGAGLTVRRYVLYSETAVGTDLVGVGLVNDNPFPGGSDVSTIPGNNLTLTFPAEGIFIGTTTDST